MFAKGRIRRGGTLERFHKAPASNSARYDTALAEIRRGRKTSHWIWFIFPQIEGLGRSSTSYAKATARQDDLRRHDVASAKAGSAPVTKKSSAPSASNSRQAARSTA
jgi:Protein of unknown function (DUF1810)